MSKSSTWQRVSKGRPCPVCGKPDWCMYVGAEDSPTAAICARIESPKCCGEAGWLHVLRDGGPTWSPRIRRIEVSAARIGAATLDFAKLAADFRAAVRPEALDKLAQSLAVSVESLRRLGIGWSVRHRCWSFPMSNAAGNVLGIRLRRPDGRKLSVRGGKEGLLIPDGLDAHDLLLTAEGPTDTAALLDLGFNVVGRPSCMGGVKLLVELARKLKPSGVVIVADGDAPGQRGAESLAVTLMAYCPAVRVITPPSGIKDAREWTRRGAAAGDVQAVIAAAPVRKLVVCVQRRAEHHG
jgi:hypothetical protein